MENQLPLSCGPEFLAEGDPPAVVMWDLNARDPERARAFFREAFGWTISDPGGPPVHLATVEGHPRGIDGVIGQAPAAGDRDHGVRHEGLIVYIKVHNVPSTLRKIESAGGTTIWGPQEVAPGFVIAQFEDPEGHRFGLTT
jgi:predicted enzyme related to lactoylglutathione lyase